MSGWFEWVHDSEFFFEVLSLGEWRTVAWNCDVKVHIFFWLSLDSVEELSNCSCHSSNESHCCCCKIYLCI